MIHTIANRLGEINWAALQPGDDVRIPWRAEPYRERLVVPCRGSESAWIRIVGVPGPNGELPIIDGENAVTDPQFAFSYPPLEPSGLVTVWRTLQSGSVVPGYLHFENLEVRGAYVGRSFTGADGIVKQWGPASGFYVVSVNGLTVKNCKIHDNGQGVFTHDGHTNTGILIEGNQIFGNGHVGSWLEHGTYIQSAGVTYRGNIYGDNRPGSNGGALKDRSADVLIEGNTIHDATRTIDLSGWQNEIAERAGWPNAGRAIIRNNALKMSSMSGGDIGAVSVMYFEGGRGNAAVQFDDNTIEVRRDQQTFWWLALLHNEYSLPITFTQSGNTADIYPATATGNLVELRSGFDQPGITVNLHPNGGPSPEPQPEPEPEPTPTGDWTLLDNNAATVGEGWSSVDWGQWGIGGARLLGAAGSASAVVYTFAGLAPGVYEVAADWPDYHNHASNVPFVVKDGDAIVGEVRVDQKVASAGGPTISAIPFQSLGQFQINSGTLKVSVSGDGATGGYYVTADAIAIRKVGEPTPVPGEWVQVDELLYAGGNYKNVLYRKV